MKDTNIIVNGMIELYKSTCHDTDIAVMIEKNQRYYHVFGSEYEKAYFVHNGNNFISIPDKLLFDMTLIVCRRQLCRIHLLEKNYQACEAQYYYLQKIKEKFYSDLAEWYATQKT
jgi:hypothetical protein